MVNVPGRSKGCHNCRKRKIKCSYERPECMQCIKSGRECFGYQRDRVFVHSDLTTEAKKPRTHARKQTGKRQEGTPDDLSPKQDSLLPVPPSENHSFPVVDLQNPLSSSLVATGQRQQVLASYVSQYESPSTVSDARAWMTAVPSIPFPSKALETAAYAVSLARIGASLENPQLQQESLRIYTQALRRTQKALWDPKLMYSDETLGACMFLAIYEVFQCPSDSRAGYTSHHDGCAKLIQLRGPAAHTDGFAHSIFQGFRFMSTLEALGRHSTFLADSDWKTIPFSKIPKKPFQKVLDILLDGPKILLGARHLPKLPTEKRVPLAVSLIHQCLHGDRLMQDFFLDLSASEGGPLYWSVPSKKSKFGLLETTPGNADLFPVSYEFPNARIGSTMILSWASLTLIWSGICQLYREISEHSTITPNLDGSLIATYTANEHTQTFQIPSPARFKEFPEMAKNVCRSVEFVAQDELSIPSLVAPLNMVSEILNLWPGFDKEVAWAKEMLGYIQSRGIKIVKYI